MFLFSSTHTQAYIESPCGGSAKRQANSTDTLSVIQVNDQGRVIVGIHHGDILLLSFMVVPYNGTANNTLIGSEFSWNITVSSTITQMQMNFTEPTATHTSSPTVNMTGVATIAGDTKATSTPATAAETATTATATATTGRHATTGKAEEYSDLSAASANAWAMLLSVISIFLMCLSA